MSSLADGGRNAAEPPIDRSGRSGSIGLVALLAAALVGAGLAISFLKGEEAQPWMFPGWPYPTPMSYVNWNMPRPYPVRNAPNWGICLAIPAGDWGTGACISSRWAASSTSSVETRAVIHVVRSAVLDAMLPAAQMVGHDEWSVAPIGSHSPTVVGQASGGPSSSELLELSGRGAPMHHRS